MKNYLLTMGPHVAAASYPSRHSMSAVLCQGQNRKGTGGGIQQRSHQSDYTNTSLWWHKGPWEVTGALLYTFGCLFMVNVRKYTIHGSYGYKELFLKYWVLLVPSVARVSNFRSARSGFWWVQFQTRLEDSGTYCWWLKSCTTWDVWNPIMSRSD